MSIRQSSAIVIGVASSVSACSEPSPSITVPCGLTCPESGIRQGNAAISGVANIDGFFRAVLDVRNAAATVHGTIRGELEAIATGLGIDGAAALSIDDLASAVKTGIETKLAAHVAGGLTIGFQPPKCEVDLEVAATAAAACDVEADAGSITARCDGTCEVSADVAAECSAMGTLTCSGQAPGFACDGTCTGSCQLEIAAACEGTCNGRCDGECSACAGGACDDDSGVVANCAGTCGGSCEGECKLDAGGTCAGRCEGSCAYEPPTGMCEANATAKCDVSAMADATCEGRCEGTVIPPMVKAECAAQVEAKATAEVVCSPPALSVDFQFAADLDADAKAEFKVWVAGFEARFAAMLAARAKADLVLGAAGDLVTAAGTAVKGSFEAALEEDLDLKIALGLGCGLSELGDVQVVLDQAASELGASVEVVVSIASAVESGGADGG